MVTTRRGYGKGLGCGYKNLMPKDPYIHGLSAKGVKTVVVFPMDKWKLYNDMNSPKYFAKNPDNMVFNVKMKMIKNPPKMEDWHTGQRLNGKSVSVWSCPCGFGGTKSEFSKHAKTCKVLKQAVERDEKFKASLNAKRKYALTRDMLKDGLPHGSGIDADWNIQDKGSYFKASNSYHAMDDMGYYVGWQDFDVIIPKKDPENFKLHLTGDRYIGKKFMLKDYLEDTMVYSIQEMKDAGYFKKLDAKSKWQSIGGDAWVTLDNNKMVNISRIQDRDGKNAFLYTAKVKPYMGALNPKWAKKQHKIAQGRDYKKVKAKAREYMELNAKKSCIDKYIPPVKPKQYFDPRLIKQGIKVEMEHTKNKKIARRIALAHLNESKLYYYELDKMEKRLK